MDASLNFSGQTAIVTGAASGFGLALVKELVSRGANVIAADIEGDRLQSVLAELNPTQLRIHLADVSDEAQCKMLVDSALEAFGRLDLAVNNAGVGPALVQSLDQLDAADLDRLHRINVAGVALGMKHQLRVMKQQQSGTILNVSSMAGLCGAPGIGGYAASKHAVIGLTKTAAVEFASGGVRVNAICPFFADTPLVTDSALNPANDMEKTVASLSRGCPMQRIARVEEVIFVMLMLLSPANSFMTGQAIAVDGGLSAI